MTAIYIFDELFAPAHEGIHWDENAADRGAYITNHLALFVTIEDDALEVLQEFVVIFSYHAHDRCWYPMQLFATSDSIYYREVPASAFASITEHASGMVNDEVTFWTLVDDGRIRPSSKFDPATLQPWNLEAFL